MTPHFTNRETRLRFRTSLLSVAVILPAILLLSVSAGCSGRRSTTVQNDEGESAGKVPVVSSIRMGDAGVMGQLSKGFYGLESGSWRWTAGNFSVVLKTPPGASERGGALMLALVVSDVILKQVHEQTLTAAIGDKTLKSEKYTTAGSFTFGADVPAALLTGDTVTVDFSLDNAMPPGPTDRRELGVIVSAAALESK